MNSLRQQFEDYVAMRRGLGYKYVKQERRLVGFIQFMEQLGETLISTKLALERATQPPGRHASWALRLTDVRGFSKYLQALDPRMEVPPTGIIRYQGRAKPYLYTQAEIEALLTAALALRKRSQIDVVETAFATRENGYELDRSHLACLDPARSPISHRRTHLCAISGNNTYTSGSEVR